MIRVALVSWALLACTVLEVRAAPLPVPVATRVMSGAEYIDANDILRALDGTKEMSSAMGISRLTFGGETLTVMDGSRIVSRTSGSLALASPVRFDRGRVWLPLSFLEIVSGEAPDEALHLSGGRLFVGYTPGHVEEVEVAELFDGREITITGRFPITPSLTARRGQIDVTIPGCIGGEGETLSSGDDLVPSITSHETDQALVVRIRLDASVTGYSWRERSEDRIRILVGDEPKGLEPIEPTPARAEGRVTRVILDAARGGVDRGASIAGVREKWLTLELARVVADSLLASGFDVYLTRNEDHDLSPEERGEIANGWTASLLLSFAFDTYPSPETPDVRCVVHGPLEDERGALAAGYRLLPWTNAQRAHLEGSLALAEWVRRSAPTPERDAPIARVPSRLLQGMDMPAVEVLIGQDVAERGPWRFWRERFAGGIVRAVERYSGRSDSDRRAERERPKRTGSR